MRHRRLCAFAAAAVLLAGCARQAPIEIRTGATGFAAPVPLPALSADGSRALDEVLAQRRSARAFRPDALPLATIGRLLWAGQGITSADGKRTAPSAGGLYPLELYVVTAGGLMHYVPDGHRVEVRTTADLRPALADAALGQAVVGDAPDVVVVAAVPARTAAKYGARAADFVHMEAGHAAQNILLEATALGLAAVPVGGLDPARVASVLALPPGQTVLYLIPVGFAE